jgi:hypothetical protein
MREGNALQLAALEESLKGRSALLKHEVAYVLGQIQNAAAIDALECATIIFSVRAPFVTAHVAGQGVLACVCL